MENRKWKKKCRGETETERERGGGSRSKIGIGGSIEKLLVTIEAFGGRK